MAEEYAVKNSEGQYMKVDQGDFKAVDNIEEAFKFNNQDGAQQFANQHPDFNTVELVGE